MTDELPYLIREETVQFFEYNPKYGDDRICKCGHPYYRHFDTYENMNNVGCKYCYCQKFIERKEGDSLKEWGDWM